MFLVKNLSSRLKQSVNAIIRSFATFMRRWLWRVALVIGFSTVGVFGSVYVALEVVTPHVHNIYSASKLVYGESRGESKRGQKGAFGSIVERIGSSQFPNTMHAVVFQPYSTTDEILQYNAMGDTIHEDLSTELGQTILKRVTWWYVQYKLGIFRAPPEARGAHSYCTPEACQRQAGYFGGLRFIGQIGNHQFYGDIDGMPTKRAPLHSIKPIPRPEPQSPSHDEQMLKEIDAIVSTVAETE